VVGVAAEGQVGGPAAAEIGDEIFAVAEESAGFFCRSSGEMQEVLCQKLVVCGWMELGKGRSDVGEEEDLAEGRWV
jgi:hypothetical protein